MRTKAEGLGHIPVDPLDFIAVSERDINYSHRLIIINDLGVANY